MSKDIFREENFYLYNSKKHMQSIYYTTCLEHIPISREQLEELLRLKKNLWSMMKDRGYSALTNQLGDNDEKSYFKNERSFLLYLRHTSMLNLKYLANICKENDKKSYSVNNYKELLTSIYVNNEGKYVVVIFSSDKVKIDVTTDNIKDKIFRCGGKRYTLRKMIAVGSLNIDYGPIFEYIRKQIFIFNPTEHKLYSKHTLIKDFDEEIREKFNGITLKPNSLLEIKINDAIVRWFDFQLGDIIKIERRKTTNLSSVDIEIIYRRVIY